MSRIKKIKFFGVFLFRRDALFLDKMTRDTKMERDPGEVLLELSSDERIKKKLLFSGSLDEQHGSEEPDDHGYRQSS